MRDYVQICLTLQNDNLNQFLHFYANVLVTLAC